MKKFYQEAVALMEFSHIKERDAYIFINLMYRDDIKAVSEEFDLSIERIRQIHKNVVMSLTHSFLSLADSYKTLRVENNQNKAEVALYREVIKEKLCQMLLDEVNRIKQSQDVLNVSIDELYLSNRTTNCLKEANINTIFDLLSWSKTNLSKLRNFGPKSLRELECELDFRFGIKLN